MYKPVHLGVRHKRVLDKARKHTDRLFKVDTRNIGWHGNAILVKRHIGILDCAALDLPTLEPRGAVIAELLVGDRPLRVVGMHLDLVGALAQAADARDPRGGRRRPQKMPTVLMGDTNEWRTVAGCLRSWSPIFTSLRPAQPFTPSIRSPRSTGSSSKGSQYRGSGVHMSHNARRASDHLPIWARLSG